MPRCSTRGPGFAFHTVAGQSFDIAAATVLPNAAFVADDPDLDGYAIVDFDAFDGGARRTSSSSPTPAIRSARSTLGAALAASSSRSPATTVADSTRSVMLFETFLPTRYYLPREDVRMDLLEPTDTQTACAYKGFASYWSATCRRHGRDATWRGATRTRTTSPRRSRG